MDNLTFVTGNPGKAEEISRYLGFPMGHVPLGLDEIQSLDLGFQTKSRHPLPCGGKRSRNCAN
jgi:hypothetical protein